MLKSGGKKVQVCPLCYGRFVSDFYQDFYRAYFRCQNCSLIFVDPESFLSSSEEKARYELHQNSSEARGYREFLNRLVEPLSVRLGKKELKGLDFGCGPCPTLPFMLEERGYLMSFYDPYFADNPSLLDKEYDFVTCSEAMEHFNSPAKEWNLLLARVKPGGWLGIMTNLSAEAENFGQWYYKNDLTHVSFYSRDTFSFLAERDALKVEFIGNDVILIRKPG